MAAQYASTASTAAACSSDQVGIGVGVGVPAAEVVRDSLALGTGAVAVGGLDDVQAESRMAARHPTTSDDEDAMQRLLPFTPP
jgi:hypothetical protein